MNNPEPPGDILPDPILSLILSALEYFRHIQYRGAIDYAGKSFEALALHVGIDPSGMPRYLTSPPDETLGEMESNGDPEREFYALIRHQYKNPMRRYRTKREALHGALSTSPVSKIFSLPYTIECAYVRGESFIHECRYEEALLVFERILASAPHFQAAAIARDGILSWHPSRLVPIDRASKREGDSIEAYEPRLSFSTPKMWKINGASIRGRRALIITQGGSLIAESSAENQFAPLAELMLSDKPPAKYTTGECLPLHASSADNFWHWIMEDLPRAVAAEAMGYTGFYTSLKGVSFNRDSLLLLGISPDRILEIEGDIELKTERTIFIELPERSSMGQYPDLYRILREKLVRPTSGKPKRLYLQRTRSRRVRNEEALLKMLYRYGFDLCNLETMTLEKQIELTSNAEAIVAPHGGAMAHLLFVRERAVCIELFSPKYVNPCMQSVVTLLSLRYTMLVVGDAATYPYGDDIEAPLSQIEEILRSYLENR